MATSTIDAITRHQVWLQRLGSQEANSFDPYLLEADKAVRDILSKADLSTVKGLNEALKEIREEVGGIYSEWTSQLIEDLEKISASEAAFNEKVLENSIPDGVAVAGAVVAAWALARLQPVQTNDKGESRQMVPMINSFTPNEVNRIVGVVRNGFAQGATNAEITQAIRGTKKNNFRDGILITTQRNAQVIARTSVNHVANTARMATFEKNKDIVSGWTFVATLDMRTSNICRFNDGREFDLGEGPIPPLHFGCRSTIAPVIKKKLRIFDDDTRASRGPEGGKQTTKSPYYNWLETQPKWFQEDVLGKTKTELFRKGGLTTEEFRKATSDRFGQPLTLEEIERNNPKAWDNAGLD